MTTLLEKAVSKASALPEEQQDALAQILLDEMDKMASSPSKLRRQPVFGSAKGLIKMSDDFDDPIEGFEPYMP